MPNTPVTWRDQFNVNTTTTGAQFDPEITQLANGNILVSWTTTDAGGLGSPTGNEVFAQIFDPLGNKVGAEIRLNNASTGDDEQNSQVAALPGGGFVVAYHDVDNPFNGGASNIRLEEYDANGVAVSDDALVVNDGGLPNDPDYQNPRVAVSSATSVLVVYEEVNAGVSAIRGKVYDTTTNTYGAQISILALAGGDTNPDVTVLTNGNYVITANVGGADPLIAYRIVNSTGGNVLPATRVTGTDTDTNNDREATVAALTGGGFVIAWTNTDANDTDIIGRVYDAAGMQTGTFTAGDTGATNLNNEPVVAGLADGSFVVVFDNDELNRLDVTHFSATGSNLGTFTIAATSSTTPVVTDLGDGRFSVVWSDSTGELSMEILDTRDNPNTPGVYTPDQWVVGTIGNDTFTADNNTDVIHGWDGNDSITGGGGQNTIDGGTGNDTLTGGAGNDVYVVDSVSDVIIEAAGDAADEVRTTLASFALGATAASVNVEHLRFIGGGGFAGTGNSGANSIFGGAGSDTLDGGAGNDTLDGGDGGDYYYIGSTDDVIVEGAGGASGYDIVIAGANFTLSDNLEQLVVQGGATQGTGNNGVNYLYGGNSGLSLRLDGGGGDDVIYAGLAGGNTLIGGSGVDTLLIYGGNNQANGGLGSDIYYTYTATDSLSEIGGDGIDTVYANWNITLGAGFEQLVLFGAANIAVGSADANIIYGNGTSGAVTIFGLAGADVIFGGAANDALNGGTENDYLFGLGGINTLIGGDGNDIFYCETFGNAVVENPGEGFDTMYSNSAGISVLGDNVEQLILYGASTGGTGTALGDYIYGNAAGNALLLSGGDGFDYILGSNQSDTFIGGLGNDSLDLRGAGAAGNDHVTYNQVGNFGSDTVFGFDADPAGGQDLIDILGMGYGAASFGTTIIIGASGGDTLVTFQGATNLAGTIIRLQGVSAATVTSADFVF